MNLEWSKAWHTTFGRSAQEIVDGRADDEDIVHEDPILGQRSTTKEELLRTFLPHQNNDPTNGIGIQVRRRRVHRRQPQRRHPLDLDRRPPRRVPSIPTNGKQITTTGVTQRLQRGRKDRSRARLSGCRRDRRTARCTHDEVRLIPANPHPDETPRSGATGASTPSTDLTCGIRDKLRGCPGSVNLRRPPLRGPDSSHFVIGHDQSDRCDRAPHGTW